MDLINIAITIVKCILSYLINMKKGNENVMKSHQYHLLHMGLPWTAIINTYSNHNAMLLGTPKYAVRNMALIFKLGKRVGCHKNGI